MQIKGLSHRLFHATFCSNHQFQAVGIPQPLWAPAPAFACFPGKIFSILAGPNFQCCKLCLLPVILPLLKRLLFPSSLQPPISSRRHQVSPQAFSAEQTHFSHSLPLHHVFVRLYSDFWCLSCTGSPKLGTVVSQGLHTGTTCFPPPASALLLIQPRVQLGWAGLGGFPHQGHIA